jgi:diguanylate cyclase (GGDEF)-like protein
MSWRMSPAVRYAPALLAFVAILVGGLFAGNLNSSLHERTSREQVQNKLALIRSKLEGAVQSDVQLVRGFVTTLRTEPYMSQQRYDVLANHMLKEKSRLKLIAAAPDLVVKYIYPLKGNEKALGLNYRTKPDQLGAIEKARDTRSLVFTGPVELVQGGLGFIVRYPVYVPTVGGQDRFWGVVSSVIEAQTLYDAAGLTDQGLGLSVAVRRLGDTNDESFFGESRIFDLNPVFADVVLPSGAWQLAAIPVDGWQTMPPNAVFLRSVFVSALFLVVLPIIFAGWLIGDRARNYSALAQRERELTSASRRLDLALSASKIGVWEFDTRRGTVLWDERIGELYGRPQKGFVERSFHDWADAVHPDDFEQAMQVSDVAIAAGQSYLSEYRLVLPDGKIRHMRTRAVPFRQGDQYTVVGAEWDVSDDVLLREDLERARLLAELRNDELEAANLRIRHNAMHDALTGLPNRRFLDDKLGALEVIGPRGLLHIDLDRFKQINDTLGHAAGDAMLVHAASVLQQCLRPDDFLARIGGDEFVVLCTRNVTADGLAQLADRIIQRMREPVPYEGHQCRFGVSVGVAIDEDSSVAPRDLLVNADIALYRAKGSGRDRFEFFTAALQSEIHSTKQLADHLLEAIEREEFVPFYQPQYDARTMRLAGVEALARWRHPTRGLLPPSEFLRVAEDLNLVATIDRLILERALSDLRSWRAKGLDIPRLSVNVSARRIRDGELIDGLKGMDIPRGVLAFELVESIFLDEQDEMLAWNVDKIKDMGIEIEIDDFGTGYASIVGLQKLKPTRLKIDRQLTMPIVSSSAQRKMFGSIIEIGKSLGIEIVAEGVETMAHAMILQTLGCDYLQGYALARPMPAEQIAKIALDAAALTA